MAFECRGVSEEALGLSDLRCIIPMNGMVDSLNVSVAAGIAMHHAVSDRTTRLVRTLIFNFFLYLFVYIFCSEEHMTMVCVDCISLAEKKNLYIYKHWLGVCKASRGFTVCVLREPCC